MEVKLTRSSSILMLVSRLAEVRLRLLFPLRSQPVRSRSLSPLAHDLAWRIHDHVLGHTTRTLHLHPRSGTPSPPMTALVLNMPGARVAPPAPARAGVVRADAMPPYWARSNLCARVQPTRRRSPVPHSPRAQFFVVPA